MAGRVWVPPPPRTTVKTFSNLVIPPPNGTVSRYLNQFTLPRLQVEHLPDSPARGRNNQVGQSLHGRPAEAKYMIADLEYESASLPSRSSCLVRARADLMGRAQKTFFQSTILDFLARARNRQDLDRSGTYRGNGVCSGSSQTSTRERSRTPDAPER